MRDGIEEGAEPYEEGFGDGREWQTSSEDEEYGLLIGCPDFICGIYSMMFSQASFGRFSIHSPLTKSLTGPGGVYSSIPLR